MPLSQTNLAVDAKNRAEAEVAPKHEPIVRANGMRTAAFFDMDHTVLQLDTGVSWMQFMLTRMLWSKRRWQTTRRRAKNYPRIKL